jgi:hypothetical protein
MRGKAVFYPMGWDDNGLPTERRVQNYFGVRCEPSLPYDPDFVPPEPMARKSERSVINVSRRNFIELCERLTAEDEQAFEALWRRLGLSVDWSLTYTTIGRVARATSQRAFLRNVARGEARPMPEWDDLGGLFTDGIRALAVYLGHLLAVMIVPVSLGCLVGLVMGGASHAGRGAGAEALGVMAGLGMLGLYVVFGLFMLVLMLYVPAALLRFALYDRVAAAFQPREVLDVIRRNIGSYLLALVLYLVANLASQVGVVLCCVGTFPLAFWAVCILAWGLGEVARRDPVLSSYGAPS